MKKIGIIGANGRIGQLITTKALAQGWAVTAIVRGDNKTQSQETLQKDLFDLTHEDVQQFDIIINAIGLWTPDLLPLHKKAVEHLHHILQHTTTHLILVGGAGSLYMDTSHTVQLKDTPTFPDIYIPVANAMADAFEMITQTHDIKWTYVTPPLDWQADGVETGSYKIGNSEINLNSNGESSMSYADYALAMIEIIKNLDANNHKILAITSK